MAKLNNSIRTLCNQLIGKRLRQLRCTRRLYQWEVGNALGFTKQQISSYERGAIQPTLETIMKFAFFYDVSFSDILVSTDFDSLKEMIKLGRVCVEDRSFYDNAVIRL